MNFSLITEPWLPVCERSGARRKISLLELADDNIAELACLRPDFQGAAYQLLIGLLQTVYPPADSEAWQDVWYDGIEITQWIQKLQSISVALQFGPHKPAFLQDYTTLTAEQQPIATLLADNSSKHFIKPGTYTAICPHCALLALFTIQTNSPAAGSGHRVSMRGGGPITTLVLPSRSADHYTPLWQKLWLNILPAEQLSATTPLPLIFPWLAATKSSENERIVVPGEEAHPLQAYWGMPRRIELDFTHTQAGSCSLCGTEHPALLTQIRQKNHGIKYEHWIHPLTPYRQPCKAPDKIPLKGNPGGLSYKDWLGLVLEINDDKNTFQPATVVAAQQQTSQSLGLLRESEEQQSQFILWCFGYDMSNAKARGWYEHHLPYIDIRHYPDRQYFTALVQRVLSLAEQSVKLLRKTIKAVQFPPQREIKPNCTLFDAINRVYWQQTQLLFERLLQTLYHDPSLQAQTTHDALAHWASDLKRYLLHAFEHYAFTNPDQAEQLLLRSMKARLNLHKKYEKLRKDFLHSLPSRDESSQRTVAQKELIDA